VISSPILRNVGVKGVIVGRGSVEWRSVVQQEVPSQNRLFEQPGALCEYELGPGEATVDPEVCS
jgi:hypothetical protein